MSFAIIQKVMFISVLFRWELITLQYKGIYQLVEIVRQIAQSILDSCNTPLQG